MSGGHWGRSMSGKQLVLTTSYIGSSGDVLTSWLQSSLNQAVPICFKTAAIRPVAKKTLTLPCVIGCSSKRPHFVQVGHNTSTILFLNTGFPQRCVLSPLQFALLTNDCCAMITTNHIVKNMDDTVGGLINPLFTSAFSNYRNSTIWPTEGWIIWWTSVTGRIWNPGSSGCRPQTLF